MKLRFDIGLKRDKFTWIHQSSLFFIMTNILISLNFNLEAQKLSVDNSNIFYQIASIYDFKQGIVSLTFDDGSKNQFDIGIPLLKKEKLPATFYLITNSVDSTSKKLLISDISPEFEFGSHTASHRDLVKIGTEEAKRELLNSQSYLKKYFGVNSGLTMSYPWGIYNNSVKKLVKSMYLAARSTDPGYNSFSTLDRYALKTQSFDMYTMADRANQWIDYSIQNHLWLVEMIHGIKKIGYSPVDSDVLEKHLNYIKQAEDDIWCSTVCNVIKYLDESKNATVSCDFCSDTIFKIRINDNMDDSIYNQPLSLKIKIPNNWDSISVSNGEKVKVEFFNDSKFILFNALPDNEEIVIRPRSISPPVTESGMRIVYLSSNPFFDNIRLSLVVLDKQDIDIILCDINGRLLIHQKEKNVTGVINMVFDTSGISNGIYILRVSGSSGDRIVKKLVKI